MNAEPKVNAYAVAASEAAMADEEVLMLSLIVALTILGRAFFAMTTFSIPFMRWMQRVGQFLCQLRGAANTLAGHEVPAVAGLPKVGSLLSPERVVRSKPALTCKRSAL